MQIDVDGDQAVGVNSGHNIYLSDVTSGLLFTYFFLSILKYDHCNANFVQCANCTNVQSM